MSSYHVLPMDNDIQERHATFVFHSNIISKHSRERATYSPSEDALFYVAEACIHRVLEVKLVPGASGWVVKFSMSSP
jgi:hypothetical protein